MERGRAAGSAVLFRIKGEIMRKTGMLAAMLLLCLSGAFPAFAAETSQVAVELDVETDGAEAYLPGTEAGYKVTLKNKLGPSWIRVRFAFARKGLDSAFSDGNLEILDGWKKHGDYYYYERKAEARTDIPVVGSLRIPEADYIPTEANVTVTVDADAVQYSAFRPDFSREDPWEGAEITHSASSSDPGGHGSYTPSPVMRLYSSPQEKADASTGHWELVDAERHVWKYHDSRGNYAKDGWIYVLNPYSPEKNQYDWFHFGEDGVMTFGWYRATDTVWYYTHETSDGNLGKLETGWHDDLQDGRRYYLDLKTGIMLSGWQEIDGRNYYFARTTDIPKQTWFWNTGIGKWIYDVIGLKSYGSMYVNEETPDGFWVDAAGIRTGGDRR